MPDMAFRRHEKKYMMDQVRQEAFLERVGGRLTADGYGQYTVSSLYYDTDSFALIRASIERPPYKEKLRLRCYGEAGDDTPVFLELKRKCGGVVYKRRARLARQEAARLLERGPYSLCGPCGRADSQVLREIAYFLEAYPLSAKALLCCERRAFTAAGEGELRITFDTGVRFRLDDLRLGAGLHGTPMLEPGKVIMEIKTPGAMPLWLCRALSELGLFPAPFSKYGACYRWHICGGPGKAREGGAHA
ncbi:MAG: polyphosphate polymerase domain-containing protein [Clostridiales Family XIII bacterium]|jgi:hypothetical protein|nr:polyphosphate polymerase domain-containing protein [Clostridiales Family XIII bacterium]